MKALMSAFFCFMLEFCSSGLRTHVENLINATKRGLQTSGSQEISTSIPTDIRDGLELVRDFWNSCADNGLVEGNKEGSEKSQKR